MLKLNCLYKIKNYVKIFNICLALDFYSEMTCLATLTS